MSISSGKEPSGSWDLVLVHLALEHDGAFDCEELEPGVFLIADTAGHDLFKPGSEVRKPPILAR